MNPRRLCMLVLATAIGVWPVGADAQVGGDGGATGQRQNVQNLNNGDARATFWLESFGGGGIGADPDTWDNVPVQIWHVDLDGDGSSEPGADSSCDGGHQHATTQLPMPSMWAESNPPAEQSGPGGVVNTQSLFWVVGYSGEQRSSGDASITVHHCTVEHRPPPLGDLTHDDSHTYTASLSYVATGRPNWYWGDGQVGPIGWGQGNDGPVPHEFQVSSGNCVMGPTCVDVPGRGPVYAVEFRVPMVITFTLGGTASPYTTTAIRHRAYPVREIESIINH